MIDSLPQAVLEAADVSAVSQLVLRERLSRDFGLWEQMRDCFHDDSVVRISWIMRPVLSSSAVRRKWPSET
jgi:hypothetical protein